MRMYIRIYLHMYANVYVYSGLLNFWGQIETKRAPGMSYMRVDVLCVYEYTATLRYHPLTATRSLRTKSCSVGSPRWLHGETNESLCESSVNLTCPRAASKAILREERSEEVEHGRVAGVVEAFLLSEDSCGA